MSNQISAFTFEVFSSDATLLSDAKVGAVSVDVFGAQSPGMEVGAIELQLYLTVGLFIRPDVTTRSRTVFVPEVSRLAQSDSLLPGIQAELNPFRPIVPPEIQAISEPLFDFMAEQAETLRQQHMLTQTGGTTFPWEVLTQLDDSQKYNLGSIGRFYHPDYGIIQARYVRLTETVPVGDWPGQPVGYLSNGNGLDWAVTNDFSKSGPNQVVGFLATRESLRDGAFTWVIVEGVNTHSIQLDQDSVVAKGDGMVWSGTGKASSTKGGVIFARTWQGDERFVVGPGEALIKLESESPRSYIEPVVAEIAAVRQQSADADAKIQALQATTEAQAAALNVNQADISALENALDKETDARREGTRKARIEVRQLETRLTEAFKSADSKLRQEYLAAVAEVNSLYDSLVNGLTAEASVRESSDIAIIERIGTVVERIETIERNIGLNVPFRMVYTNSADLANGQTIDSFIFDSVVTIPAGAAGSQFKAKTAPSADTTLEFRRNGVLFGTVLYASGSLNGTLSWGSNRLFEAGDVLDIVTLSSTNGLKGIHFSLVGRYGK